MRSGLRSVAVIAAAVLWLSLTLGVDAAKKSEHRPRPVSRAEAAAVEIVAEFLARGPEAVHERLAPESPLASLTRQEALDEIEARTGPAEGAAWRLQTVVPSLADRTALFGVEFSSGIDDVIEVSLVEHEGRFDVLQLRSLAEPSPRAVRTSWMEPDVSAVEPGARAFSLLDHITVVGGLIALLAMASLAVIRARRELGRLMIGGTIVVCGVSLGLVVMELARLAPEDVAPSSGESQALAIDRLGTLVDERRSLAAGTPMVVDSTLDAKAGNVAAIWNAQALLRDQKLDEATKALERFPLATERPMVAILRARLAAAAYDEIATSLAYERAMRLGPGRDDLWFETAQWLYALGFEDRAIGYLNRLPVMGSRNADAWYALASISASRSKRAESVVFLETAWDLEPVPRTRIISTPALTSVMRNDVARSLVSLSSPVEPQSRAEADPALLIDLPDNADATVTGSVLSISLGGDRSLRVDGGAVLVGDEVEVVDAVSAAQRDENRYLDDFQSLLAASGSPSALAHPAVRERYLRTATALAERHRWDDVERLTTSLSASAENVPPDLIFLRGTALRKLNRENDARRLLAEMVTSPAMQRRSDPRILYQLGEMLAAMELYTPAIRTLERVDAMMDDLSLDDRIRQLSMNQRLAEHYAELTSPNFVFHYPDDVDESAIRRLSEVMEAELARLKKIFPISQFRPTTVNVLWWNEFRSTYTGSDHILGFYDGKITLPLAGISRMNEPVVALVTHELAHAVIAQATDDRAPAWIQEGLAQRVEMVPYHANAFNMYESSRLLPMTLLNTVLTESVDGDLIGQAYITSQTAVRFLESRYGAKIIPSLLASIRDGNSVETALTELTGSRIDEIEIEFREWGQAGTRVFENRNLIRYDTSGDAAPAVRFSKRSGTR